LTLLWSVLPLDGAVGTVDGDTALAGDLDLTDIPEIS
jgi:hypothetical protein